MSSGDGDLAYKTHPRRADDELATCSRCARLRPYAQTRLFWSPGRGTFRICSNRRSCDAEVRRAAIAEGFGWCVECQAAVPHDSVETHEHAVVPLKGDRDVQSSR